jgi:hypothetical protein
LDTDGSRQVNSNLLITVLFLVIELMLFFNSRINILNLYIIGNTVVYNLLKDKLLNEGYYIKNKYKGVYLIYPILYGDRN